MLAHEVLIDYKADMDTHSVLLQIVIILLSARLLGEIAAYFSIPSVIGELAAGVILGPSILGLIQVSDPLHLLAQIGIILLLFEVGIETDIGKLASAGVQAMKVAALGVILPFAFGYLLSYYVFEISFMASLFIASTLTATSIGITLRVLRDLKKQTTHEAQIVIGAAVLDDIIGIIMLAFLYEFAMSGKIDLYNTAKLMVFIAIFFVVAPFIAKAFVKFVNMWDKRSEIPGLLPATIVSLILLFAWVAHAIGAPELLGGFVAGLALSKKFFSPFGELLHSPKHFTERIETQMQPIVQLFAPIFFVVVGLQLNLRDIPPGSSFVWLVSGSLLVAAILGKLLCGFTVTGATLQTKLAVGTAMIPRGEVGLIFANIGLTSGVFGSELYACLIVVVALTTLLAPLALRKIYTHQSQ